MRQGKNTMISTRHYPAWTWFFPAASLYAALWMPLSLWVMLSGDEFQTVNMPNVSLAYLHAQELLFGFALAVIAGYLLGPLPFKKLAPLFLLWLLARLGILLAPQTLMAPLAGSGFVLLLAWQLVPRFKAAKKWRNRLLSPLLLAICLAAVAAQWSSHMPLSKAVPINYSPSGLLYIAVLLLALLMLFMGGRVIAPAVAGYRQRLGGILKARVQPNLEAGLILAMLLAIGLAFWPMVYRWAGVPLVLAGLIGWLRLLRWQPWHCLGRPDLLCLGIGYAWLGTGLIVNGIALLAQQSSVALIHVITVGALGTLTSGIMLRTALLAASPRSSLDLGREKYFAWITGLIAIATLSRLFASFTLIYHVPLLWIAATAWSLAWCLLGLRLASVANEYLIHRNTRQAAR
ncbi:NnrS family protein [Pistricoccus aurantiacus]|uniref:NnrS family protein n=1 Tax=Pistricoccus aurantiacus TaxID=1883414 RepID=A0A5B8SQ47_9GAMM|nr:NnrS family protein [Pistricoccus aurantiacus]QEA39242.1 NnrS family protein [Pistricoccus aurantiacus]